MATNIRIVNGPENVTTTVGSAAVTFECNYEGTTDLPYWRINRTEYRATSLPAHHQFIQHTLHVQRIAAEMNNTKYVCFFYEYDFSIGQDVTIESPPAFLFVVSEIIGKVVFLTEC